MTGHGTETRDVGLEGETLLLQSKAFVATAVPYVPFGVTRRDMVEWGHDDRLSVDRRYVL